VTVAARLWQESIKQRNYLWYKIRSTEQKVEKIDDVVNEFLEAAQEPRRS